MARKSKEVSRGPKKDRKPYPSYQERIDAADVRIEKLNALIAERSELIDKTAKLLQERQDALAKNQAALKKVIEKRARLVINKDKAAAGVKVKLTPEQIAEKRRASLAKRREIKKAEKAKMETLMSALQSKGKTLDDLLETLTK